MLLKISFTTLCCDLLTDSTGNLRQQPGEEVVVDSGDSSVGLRGMPQCPCVM